MLGSPPIEYLTDVVYDSKSASDCDTFALIYKGVWKEKQVRVKKFYDFSNYCVEPLVSLVFLIPSDIIHYLTLNNLQNHIKRHYKDYMVNKWHLFMSQYPYLTLMLQKEYIRHSKVS